MDMLELVGALKGLSTDDLNALLLGDTQQAVDLVRAAADCGLPEGQVRFGRMLLEGRGLSKNHYAAFDWFQCAAAQGSADGLNMVGRCFENGWGITVDLASAALFYLQAAELGDSWAQYNLGHLYLDGLGVERNPGLAFHWYSAAANRGHARAMNLLARCYEEAWGTGQDLALASFWYRKSAEGGYFRGQYNWATLLTKEGHIAAATEWFLFAARGGTPAVRSAIVNTLRDSDHVLFRRLSLKLVASGPDQGETEERPLPEPSGDE